MSALPAAYAWLKAITPPRIISEALELYGIVEIPGPVNAPARNRSLRGWGTFWRSSGMGVGMLGSMWAKMPRRTMC